MMRVQVHCWQCGAGFQVKPYKVTEGGRLFCSRPCYYAGQVGHTAYNGNTSETVWSRIQRGEPDECWPWIDALDEDGYGYLSWEGRSRRAHRLVYELMSGKGSTDNYQVLHMCEGRYPIGNFGSRACCNPRHLKLGDPFENVQDTIRSGRIARGLRAGSRTHIEKRPRGDNHSSRLHPEKVLRGERHGQAKLTEHQVIAILLRAPSEPHRTLAREFGVNQSTVDRIVGKRLWAHVVTPVDLIEPDRS